MFNPINCRYFEQAQCHSCQWLTKSYPQQLSEKSAELKRLVSPFILQNGETEILPPHSSPLIAFRNKAKMVVSGSVERPILGIQSDPNDHQSAIDLCECPLYPTTFSALFLILKQFIGRAGLVPYNVAKKRGELKYILLTQSQYNQSIMLRFVLKSERKRPLVERELPALLTQLPPNSVVSLNIQPYHSAILEGEQEIFLTEQTTLTEYFNGVPLFIRPQGFFQTNPSVAAQLYATAQQWVKHLPITQIWDLFCGVGGFGLHCAKILQPQQPQLALTGIEISAAAIASASKSAALLNLKQVKFDSLDSTQFALCQDKKPDLVIVNPPRRGIGRDLADYLNQLKAPYLLYSSCNAQTMAKDFAHLSHYRLKKMQLFDMFPHTSHYEVLTFLERNT